MVPDGGGVVGGVPCDYCAEQRALLHCAQHGTRLCLLCDVPVHVHGASEGAGAARHERAPLCQCCHAAPAAVRCAAHRVSLCAHCATAVGCDAQGHAWSPTSSYTGFPDPADLARILGIDAPPADVPPAPPTPAIQEPPETWVPDLVNVELMKAAAAGLPGQCIIIKNELPSSSLIQTGGNFEKQAVAGDGAAAMAGGVVAALPTGGGIGAAGRLTQDYSDWYNNNLPEDPADDFNSTDNRSFTAPLANSLVAKPEAAWWSSSVYDADPQPLNPSSSYSSETVMRHSTDHAVESLAGNNAAFRLSSSVMSTAANTSTSTPPHQLDLLTPVHQQLPLLQGNTPKREWLPPPHQLPPQCKFFNRGLPIWPPNEFPSMHLGQLGDDEHLTPAKIGSTTVVHQDQDAPMQQQAASSAPAPVPVTMPGQESSQDMEARRKLKEKREQSVQRYKEKRKNRRFGKKVMYVSRKVRADTRHRINGRFAKASTSGSDGHG